MAVTWHGEGPIVGGGATGGRDLVLIVEGVRLPCVDGVILEAGEDRVGHWLEEHLKGRV
jgi:hypothetical protein